MYDFTTAMQIALSPVFTLSVIAALVIIIAAQAYFDARRLHNRLRAQAKKLGKMTAAMLAAMTVVHKRDTERQIGRAIGAAFDAMKDIGFDKLASGEVEFEGVMFGDTPFKPSQRHDPFSDLAFSLDDLKDALRPGGGDGIKETLRPGEGPNGEKYAGGGRVGGDPFAGEGNGGSKGPRPYHTARPGHMADDFDLSGRSPRAG